jgi:Icc-related predicted phosphoesterase
MSLCLFVSDLHGSIERFEKLYQIISAKKPELVFLGGDLLPFDGFLSRPQPNSGVNISGNFLTQFLFPHLVELKDALREKYPRLLVILGNDDPRREEKLLGQAERLDLLHYLHNRKITYKGFNLYGYSCIPPTPFLLKDWERYDVSRFVDVGAVPPTAGWRTVSVPPEKIAGRTIKDDLRRLSDGEDLRKSIFLFHAPPYNSALDRAALDGRMIDGAPVDVHVGSIAVRSFIEERSPLITLHGHVHESARLTGAWQERIGTTLCFSAAHDGPELAVVEFALENPGAGKRTLV